MDLRASGRKASDLHITPLSNPILTRSPLFPGIGVSQIYRLLEGICYEGRAICCLYLTFLGLICFLFFFFVLRDQITQNQKAKFSHFEHRLATKSFNPIYRYRKATLVPFRFILIFLKINVVILNCYISNVCFFNSVSFCLIHWLSLIFTLFSLFMYFFSTFLISFPKILLFARKFLLMGNIFPLDKLLEK